MHLLNLWLHKIRKGAITQSVIQGSWERVSPGAGQSCRWAPGNSLRAGGSLTLSPEGEVCGQVRGEGAAGPWAGASALQVGVCSEDSRWVSLEAGR